MDVQLGLFGDEPLTPKTSPVEPAAPDPHHAELARRLPAGLRLGTSSWSFPGWADIVYDRKASPTTLAQHGLAAYARHPLFRTVGVDRSFYRPVPIEDLQRYADAVPDEFRFLVKAERLLTSPHDPTDRSFRGPNPRFLDAAYARDHVVTPFVEGLGGKGGPLLFQFPPIPPNLVGGRSAFLTRLGRFLEALPEGPLYAVELRTPAFLTEEYASVLESTGTVHCYTVHSAMSPLEEQLRVVRHFEQRALVVRWMLHSGLGYEAARGRYEPFDRIVDADDASLRAISRTALDALIAERDVFIVVNNKAEGSSPLSVFRLAERLATWRAAP